MGCSYQIDNDTYVLSDIVARKSNLLTSNFAKTHLFGEIKESNEDLKKELKLSGEGYTRTSLLAFKAFQESIESAGLDQTILSSNRTAFISATTVGGMSQTEQLNNDANIEESTSPFLDSYNFSFYIFSL